MLVGTVDAVGKLAEVHALDADLVAEDVGVGVVAEAGVLVFLVLGLVRDGHALAGELTRAQRADAAQDVGDRLRRRS